MSSTPIIQLDIDEKLVECDKSAEAATGRIYTTLGNMLLTVDDALGNTQLRETLEGQLITIDDEVRGLKATITHLTQSMTVIASFARIIQNQRDQALSELRGQSDRADEAEATVEERIYNRMLETMQETFYCSRDTADKLLHAIFWNAQVEVDDVTAERLDSIANIIGD